MKRLVQNKKALSMALAAALAIAPVSAFAASNDIRGHWAERTITQWQDKGLIGGYQDGTFKPDKPATRAEFARIMNQALGLNHKGNVSFSDVSSRDWFYNDVAIAMGEQYTAGYPDGTFKPNEIITRAQAAVFIAKALGASGGSLASFKDASSIPAWAQGAVGGIVEKGYMSGYPDGTFRPNAVLTRAEAVSTLNRIMGVKPVEEETKKTEKDVVIDESGTKLKDQTIEGNLTISDKVGKGKVTLSNVEIKGDLIIQGGGENSVYLDNTVVEGKTVMDKKNVHLEVSGKTKLPNVEIKKACSMTTSNFSGEVKKISITSAISDKTTIGVSADKLYVEGKANLYITRDIAQVIVEKDAAGTELEISSNGKVSTLTADGKVALSGSGKISTLEANVDGITYTSAMTINKTETAKGVDKPSRTNESSSSSSSSSKTSVSAIGITGTAVVGAKLTATPTPAAATGTYQWQRCDTVNGTYTNITGATASTYTIATGDAGKYLRVVFSASGNYKGTQTSVATAAIGTAVVPSVKVTALAFTDTDTDAAQMGGTVTWTAPTNVSNVTGYVVYASTDGITKGAKLGEVGVGTNQLVIPANTTYAAHIIVVAKNITGEAVSANYASVAVTDVVADPAAGATSELAKVTDAVVTTVPNGTTNDKASIEAAMLVLANAAVDSANYTVTIASGSAYDAGTKAWTGKFVVTNKTTPANTKTDAANRNITVVIAADPAAGATSELAKVTDAVVTTVPNGTTNDKASIEAAMLVLANAAVDSANYTVTIASGSTYDAGTKAWTGKFVVTNKTTPANTKTDAANRNITVVIAADPAAGATSELAKVTDAVVTTVPNGTTNDKASIEAAMLVLANAAVDSANYTVTIASGSAYDAGTKAWTGKFVVTNKTTPANTKTDAANRNITVVIAA